MFNFSGQFGWGQPSFGLGGGTDFSSIISGLFQNIMSQSQGRNPFLEIPPQPQVQPPSPAKEAPPTPNNTPSPPTRPPQAAHTQPQPWQSAQTSPDSQPSYHYSGGFDSQPKPQTTQPVSNNNDHYRRGGGLLGLGEHLSPENRGWPKLAGDISPGFGARR